MGVVYTGRYKRMDGTLAYTLNPNISVPDTRRSPEKRGSPPLADESPVCKF